VTTLLVERDGGVTQLTLNRPEKANALDEALVEALLAAFAAAQRDDTRLLVLRPGPKNFSAGFDFTGAVEGGERRLLWRFVRIEQLLLGGLPCAVCHHGHRARQEFRRRGGSLRRLRRARRGAGHDLQDAGPALRAAARHAQARAAHR
jgi:enoyl-CoA hydratase/carnithine racemase